MTNEERRPTGLLHTADELRQQSQVWERLSHCSPQNGRGQASYRL